jgi:transposase
MESMVGIDVGKCALEVYLEATGKTLCLENTKAGTAKLVRMLSAHSSRRLVVFEAATGGYERLLRYTLSQAGIPFHVAHANKVRAYAKAQGRLAKTDRLDAKLIADYARALKLKADGPVTPPVQQELRGLIQRRRQLIENRTQELNRLEKPLVPAFAQVSIKRHLAALDKELKRIEEAIERLIATEPSANTPVQLLASVHGVGALTAATLWAECPELGAISHRALSALVGVAPFNHDSGQRRGKRRTQGGRAAVRGALYMAALAAIRHDSPLRTFYQHLRAKGKLGKVALVAVMRKLLTMLNCVMRRGTPWVKDYQPA